MQLNRRSEKDQRTGEDRRKENGDAVEVDQRSEADQRRSDDRRILRYAVLFKTGIPVVDLETWLGANCQSEWDMVLEDMDDNLMSKTLKIMFETPEDRELFKASTNKIRSS
jgi:hypothetical protein